MNTSISNGNASGPSSPPRRKGLDLAQICGGVKTVRIGQLKADGSGTVSILQHSIRLFSARIISIMHSYTFYNVLLYVCMYVCTSIDGWQRERREIVQEIKTSCVRLPLLISLFDTCYC